MSRWRMLGNDRGVALVLALMILLTLTGLVLAFLSVSAFEPQISRNLSDGARARYLAEAGLEMGFNALIATADANSTWTGALTSATSSSPWVAVTYPSGSAMTNVALPGMTSASAGSYSVTVRNDTTTDTAITGLTGSSSPTADSTASTDVNKVVIMRATGTFNGASKTLEVVVWRLALPPFPGAVNVPGAQADTYLNTQTFDIDGRDYTCSSNCDTATNWTTSDPAGTRKYGFATQTGTQSNVGITYEARVESAFGTSGSCNTACSDAKKASVKGKSEVDGSYTTGLNTVQEDSSLNPTVMSNFLTKLANFPGTQIFQSTMACPMILAGNSSDASQPTLRNNNGGTGGSSCTVNQTLDLGSQSNPKLVYFRGQLDTTSAFTGLALNSASTNPPIKGAGILVVEDGDLKNYGNFEWDGLVIVTGSYVSAAFMSGSNTKVRGALTGMESQPGEAAGYFDFYLNALANQFSVRYAKQNVDMVQIMRALHSMSSWREI